VVAGALRAVTAIRHARTRRTLIALVALLCAAGCAFLRPKPAMGPPLRVGTSGDYPPFSLRAADGTYTGLDVEVARAYAAARQRPLELVPFAWPELAARLAAGEFDVAMSGVTVRADRLLIGTMTAAVARADAILLVRRGEEGSGDFDRPERRIAVNRGGHLEQVARVRFARAAIETVDDNRQLPVLLRERRVDAVVTDTLEAATFQDPSFVAAMTLARDRKAYWAAPGREQLAEDLDAWLAASEQDGTLGRLRTTHLPAGGQAGLPAPVGRVVDVAARRLSLMPLVAAAKRAAELPVVDAGRERAVIDRNAERAAAAGLDPGVMRALVLTEIAAARAVQTAVIKAEGGSSRGSRGRGTRAGRRGARAEPTPQPTASPAAAEIPSLNTLRTAIDAVDGALVRALVAARGAQVERGALAHALRTDAELPGFDEEHARAIAAALQRMLQTAPLAR
jgi:cyclohexadienyl dehydratase